MDEVVKYYPFPLVTDRYHYIWAANDLMTFEFVDIDEPENMQKVVDIINGVSNKVLPDISIDYPYILCCGQKLLEVRGKEQIMAKFNLEKDYVESLQKILMIYCAKKLGKNL